MSDVHADANHVQIILHDDDETPIEFVIDLLHSVFDKPMDDAIKLTETVDRDGQASCGTYSSDAAEEMLEAARQRVLAAGHPLRITSQAIADSGDGRCQLCGVLASKNRLSLKGVSTPICDECMYEITNTLHEVGRNLEFQYACDALAWHFAGIPSRGITDAVNVLVFPIWQLLPWLLFGCRNSQQRPSATCLRRGNATGPTRRFQEPGHMGCRAVALSNSVRLIHNRGNLACCPDFKLRA